MSRRFQGQTCCETQLVQLNRARAHTHTHTHTHEYMYIMNLPIYPQQTNFLGFSLQKPLLAASAERKNSNLLRLKRFF